ncbi:MAG: ATP-binding protein [Pseudomonadota bacterium]
MKTERKIILIAVTIAALGWILDATVDRLFFGYHSLAEAMFHPSVHEVFMRGVLAGGIAIFGSFMLLGLARRKLAEEALKIERQRFFSVLDTIPAFIYLQGPGYQIRFANRFFKERFGEPDSQPCYSILWKRDTPCEGCPTLSYLHARGPNFADPGAREYTDPADGRTYAVYDNPFSDVDGTPMILKIGVDITDRKRAEQEVEQARRRIEELARREERRANWLAIILDQLPVGAVIVGTSLGKGLLTNKKAEELAGGGSRFLWPDQRPMTDEETALSRAISRGEHIMDEEFVLERPDGSRVDLMANAAPLLEGGEVAGGVLVFWDTTAQKEAQRRLQEAGRLKDEFISMASHELKTPITTIKIFSELASRDPSRINPKLTQALGRQADQLVALVNDLLELSRLNLGRLPMNMKTIDIATLVRKVCESPLLGPRLVFCPNYNDAILVTGDPVRLEQLLSNLLDNAVKYSAAGSRIWMRVNTGKDKVSIEVQDEGIGISAEHLPHIFERFYKPGTQQAVYSGLGVGLYICKEIVARHGGRIWAESHVGQGSTFHVELPATILSAGQPALSPGTTH